MYEEVAAKRNGKLYQAAFWRLSKLTNGNGVYMADYPWVGALHMPTGKWRRKCPTRRVDPILVLIARQILVRPKCRDRLKKWYRALRRIKCEQEERKRSKWTRKDMMHRDMPGICGVDWRHQDMLNVHGPLFVKIYLNRQMLTEFES